MASVEERVIDIVAEQLGVEKEKVSGETSFVNDLNALVIDGNPDDPPEEG